MTPPAGWSGNAAGVQTTMALMRDWYSRNLGINFDSGFNGTVFSWPAGQTPDRPGSTVWSLFSADTEYFAPSQAAFVINFRVDDLNAMLAQLGLVEI